MSYYDHHRRMSDTDLFVRLRAEQTALFEPADVEDAWGDNERLLNLVADLLVRRVRAQADALGRGVTADQEHDFRETLAYALDELFEPVQAGLDRAWRESRADPHAEHRLTASDLGVAA